jgi:hypothetical protein
MLGLILMMMRAGQTIDHNNCNAWLPSETNKLLYKLISFVLINQAIKLTRKQPPLDIRRSNYIEIEYASASSWRGSRGLSLIVEGELINI